MGQVSSCSLQPSRAIGRGGRCRQASGLEFFVVCLSGAFALTARAQQQRRATSTRPPCAWTSSKSCGTSACRCSRATSGRAPRGGSRAGASTLHTQSLFLSGARVARVPPPGHKMRAFLGACRPHDTVAWIAAESFARRNEREARAALRIPNLGQLCRCGLKRASTQWRGVAPSICVTDAFDAPQRLGARDRLGFLAPRPPLCGCL